MNKVFIVTSGEYSDYGINAVFSTRELAQAYIDAYKTEDRWNDMSIDEWELDPHAADLSKGRKAFKVDMRQNGDSEVERMHEDYYRIPNIAWAYANAHMTCFLFADDEQHAVKIANEKRIQILAANQWGQPQS